MGDLIKVQLTYLAKNLKLTIISTPIHRLMLQQLKSNEGNLADYRVPVSILSECAFFFTLVFLFYHEIFARFSPYVMK